MMKKIYLLLATALAITTLQAQISIVKDINPGTGNSSPANLFIDGDYIYFAADDASATVDHGKELWRTNGTTTELVKDIRSGSSNSTPGNFFSFNNKLYLTAHNGSASVAFITDGTESGTTDLELATGMFWPKEYVGKVYFIKTTENNAMYEFDGTNIQRVTNNGTLVENVLGGVYTVLNDKALLYMKNNLEDKDNIQGTEVGAELYEYDFSTGLYALVKNISADVLSPAESVDINNSGISNMVNLGTKVYFEAESALWETDGTTGGTMAIATASSLGFVANLYAWDGKLFFEGDDGTNGDQLYVFDPAGNTVTNISNITGVSKDHDPSDYCDYNGYLYYRGEDGNDTDGHLFRTDGTTITQLNSVIKDIDEIVELNGILYFEGEDASGTETTGNELFMLDPTTIVTAIGDELEAVKKLSIHPNPSNGLVQVNGLESARASYELFDLTGKSIEKGIIAGGQIDYNVNAGIYLLQIIDGANTSIQKIVVK